MRDAVDDHRAAARYRGAGGRRGRGGVLGMGESRQREQRDDEQEGTGESHAPLQRRNRANPSEKVRPLAAGAVQTTPFTTFSSGSPRTAARAMRAEVAAFSASTPHLQTPPGR